VRLQYGFTISRGTQRCSLILDNTLRHVGLAIERRLLCDDRQSKRAKDSFLRGRSCLSPTRRINRLLGGDLDYCFQGGTE
jgi:hypothetical protein